MGKLVVGILGLVVGIVIGAIGGLNLGGGAMMGAGIAAGLSTGICLVAEGAQQAGLLSAEQVDEVLQRAVQGLPQAVEVPPDARLGSTAAECERVLADLRRQG